MKMERVTDKLSLNPPMGDITKDLNCVLCKGQNTLKAVENEMLERKQIPLELERLRHILFQLTIDHYRNNASENNLLLQDDVISSSQRFIDSLTSVNGICRNCTNLMYDYDSISLKLEQIRKIIFPCLLLLIKKFGSDGKDNIKKIETKDHFDNPGRTRMSKNTSTRA